jgi:hypothetical protein
MTVSTSLNATRLVRLQLGQESTWGTPATATAILNGVQPTPTITPAVKSVIFDEQLGSLVPAYHQAQVELGGSFDMKGYVTYEDILYLLSGVYGLPTPAGSYTWTFTIPSTTAWTPVSYTMELGISGSSTATKLVGGLFQDWSITGSEAKELTFTAKGFGQSVSYGVTPTSLSYHTPCEMALMPQVAVAMGVAGTGVGSLTAYSGSLVNFTLSGNSGLVPFKAAGSKYPASWCYTKQTLGLKVAMAYTSTLQTFIGANQLAGSPVVLQLKATSGAKIIEIDFAGALKSDPVYWGDSQGAQIVELDMDAVYDATDAFYTKFVVTNTVATLA